MFRLGILGVIALQFIVVTTPCESQQRGGGAASHDISGIVTTTNGTPISEAHVAFDRVATAISGSLRRVTRTADDGKFAFGGLAGGQATITVRRIGYQADSVTFTVDTLAGDVPFRILLRPVAVALDTMKVTAQERRAIQEFNERRRKRSAGYFMDRSEIEQRRAAYSSDLVRRFPGIVARPSRRGGNVVRMRNCRPAIFIDGIHAMNAELDEVTRPSDIEAIEVYSSWAGVPPQFSDRFGQSCGAILIWTRIR